ncbi:hypothetical protein KGM_201442 [Danaus plexippus plexippus]|uniref:Uncharacterized protein n=1 Tax=Danaus plexippus plexippus TaxID=278856 RepID=A0A212EL05_DANPL|nr:hypothetical protein KGM_201442 [Danaus plexippus plexippus]
MLLCNAALGLRIFPIETANTVKPSIGTFVNFESFKNVNVVPSRIEQTTYRSVLLVPTQVRPVVPQTIADMKIMPTPNSNIVKSTERPVLQDVASSTVLQMTKEFPEAIFHEIMPTPSLSTGEATLHFAALSAYHETSTSECIGAIAPTSVIKVQETFDLTSK